LKKAKNQLRKIVSFVLNKSIELSPKWTISFGKVLCKKYPGLYLFLIRLRQQKNTTNLNSLTVSESKIFVFFKNGVKAK